MLSLCVNQPLFKILEVGACFADIMRHWFDSSQFVTKGIVAQWQSAFCLTGYPVKHPANIVSLLKGLCDLNLNRYIITVNAHQANSIHGYSKMAAVPLSRFSPVSTH